MCGQLSKNLIYLAELRGLIKNVGGDAPTVNQSALEDLCGVPQTTISGILSQGKAPRLGTLERLAQGLGVGVWQLLAPPEVLQASLTPQFPKIVSILVGD